MWNINRDCNPSITIIIFHIMPGVMWNINHESNVLDFGGNVDHLMLGLWLWNGYSHGWYYCLFVGGSVTTITRNWVQTGFVGKGSDHLQLIEFWPSCAPPGGRSLRWGENFSFPPYYSQRTVCVSSEHFFILDLTTAYDTFWHLGLLMKLSKVLPTWVVDTVAVFLQDRLFQIHVGDKCSLP